MIIQSGELEKCGDDSSYTCTHQGGKYCGRFRELQEKA